MEANRLMVGSTDNGGSTDHGASSDNGTSTDKETATPTNGASGERTGLPSATYSQAPVPVLPIETVAKDSRSSKGKSSDAVIPEGVPFANTLLPVTPGLYLLPTLQLSAHPRALQSHQHPHPPRDLAKNSDLRHFPWTH